jgi:uncharacterized protein (DUF779 family)
VKERSRNVLKGGFYQRMGDVCIGTIEEVEFWVDKDLFEYWKHAHFTLKVIDALWCRWIFFEKDFFNTEFYA